MAKIQPKPARFSFGAANLLIGAVICATCFFLGTLAGMHAGLVVHESCERGGNLRDVIGGAKESCVEDAEVDARVEAIVKKRVAEEVANALKNSPGVNNGGEARHFSKKMSKIASGAVRATKADLQSLLDFGVPTGPKEPGPGDKEALILYNSADALPTDAEMADAAVYGRGGDGLPMLSAADATANCDAVNVIAVGNPGHTRQCVALVSNYESYHVQRWMRLKSVGGNLDGAIEPKEPLRHVSRGHAAWGKREFVPPTQQKNQIALEQAARLPRWAGQCASQVEANGRKTGYSKDNHRSDLQ